MSLVEKYETNKLDYSAVKNNQIVLTDLEKQTARDLNLIIRMMKKDINNPDPSDKLYGIEQNHFTDNTGKELHTYVFNIYDLEQYIGKIINRDRVDLVSRMLVGDRYNRGLFFDINFNIKVDKKNPNHVYVYIDKPAMVFDYIYQYNIWNRGHKHTPSGEGSTVDNTLTTRRIIIDIINQYKITHIWDVACGDFTWMSLILQAIDGPMVYRGTDISKYIISATKKKYIAEKNKYSDKKIGFKRLDMTRKKSLRTIRTNRSGGLIVCREVFQHMTTDDVLKAINVFGRSGYEYVLITNYLTQPEELTQIDIFSGGTNSRNLHNLPFNLPKTKNYYEKFKIHSESGNPQILEKYMSLWRVTKKNFVPVV